MSLQFGEFELDRERRQLLRSGQPVPLEPKAYELLSLLVERRPRALSRAQIRDVVWSGVFVSESTLGVAVNAIRQALGDDARQPRFVRTVHGFGYAFCGEVAGDGGPDSREAPKAAEPRGPYPGLASFKEEDAEVFFGREAEVEALWERLQRRRLLALIGPSGAGKTSFVRAGLIPAHPEGWGAIVSSPGRTPMTGLAQALAPEVAGDAEAVKELLRFEDPEVAVAMLRRWRQGFGEALLVVDQFEELFTLNPSETQARFAELLGRLSKDVDVHVLLSLRDDFLIRCSEHEALAPVFTADLTPLLVLESDGLRRALVEPAQKEGFAFEDDSLVEEMLDSVEGARGALPLLAFAVSRLWGKRDRERKLLTRAAYEEAGGVAGALAQHAEQTLDQIGPEREPVVRELFRNLVTAQWTRAAAERDELLSVLPDREVGGRVLDALIDARLLTSYEVRATDRQPERGVEDGRAKDLPDDQAVGSSALGSGHHRIEIVHESLLRAWPRLVRWQAQDEEGALLRDQLKQAAHLWEEKGRPDDLLWTGTSEREFELWRDRYPGALTAVEDDFADAMIHRARRRKQLRRLVAASVVAAAVVVASVTGVLWQRSDVARRQAEAAELLALGRLELEDHPTAGLAYALASLELSDSPAARRFALETLEHGAAAIVLPQETHSLGLSADGRWLATGTLGQPVRLWSRDGGPPVPIGRADGVPMVYFDPDGPLLSVFDWRTLQLYAIEDAKSIRQVAAEDVPEDVWLRLLRGSRLYTFAKGPRGTTLSVRSIGEGQARGLARWDSGDKEPWWPDVSSDGAWSVFPRGRQIFSLALDERDALPRLVGEHLDDVVGVGFPFRSDRLLSADRSGEIRIWEIKEGVWALKHTIHSGLESPMVSLDRTGSTLVAGQAGHHQTPEVAHIWDLNGPPDAEPLVLRKGDVINLLVMGMDGHGQWLATANNLNGVLWPLGGRRARIIRGQAPPYIDVAFTPDGKWLASSSSEGVVRLWPLSPTVASEGRILIREQTKAHRIAFGPKGRNVLVASQSPGRAVLVPLDGTPPRTLERFSAAWLESPAISRDGTLGAAGSRWRSEGNLIEVWDLRSGAVRTLDPRSDDRECGSGPEMESAVFDVEFTSDGRLLSAGLSGLRLWNVDDGTNTLLRPCSEGPMYPNLGGSLVDRFLLAETDIALKTSLLSFHDLRTGVSRELTSHGRSVRAVALDPQGEIAATGDWDGVVRVGPVTGEDPHLFYGHDFEVTSVAVSPDGQWIASGSQDGTIRLWPMPKGRPFHTLPYDELLARLRSFTNLRVVRDEGSETGYRVEAGPFPGWAVQPEW